MFSGCFSYQPAKAHFTIQDPVSVQERKKFPVWIKIVNLPDYDKKQNLFVTYNLYKFVRELNQFEKVNILYFNETKLSGNAIVLEFQFSKLDEKDKFHPLFFPLSITGMALSYWQINSSTGFTLYSIFGGPTMKHRVDYEANLIAYDASNKEITRVPISFQSEFNSNILYYERDREANEKRREMLEPAILNLVRKLEEK